MSSTADSGGAASVGHVAQRILLVRGQRVLLDADLAELYGVATRVLLQAVKRNRERFPEDFMVQLSRQEWQELRSQVVISSGEHGGRRYPPRAFTEQGTLIQTGPLGKSGSGGARIRLTKGDGECEILQVLEGPPPAEVQ